MPIHLIAAEECEIDAGIARGLDVRTLIRRPIFIVANRQKSLAVQQLCAVTGGVDARDVFDIVAVLSSHRIVGYSTLKMKSCGPDD